MCAKIVLTSVFIVLTLALGAGADTITFRNGAVLEGRMLGGDQTHIRFESDGTVGNYSRDDVTSLTIGDAVETTTPPDPEPKDLDVPTRWQEGDPNPVETTVPETEPKQQSEEAPPAQPMEDEQYEAPGPTYVWVSGYWWWYTDGYVWVPGYWSIPPYYSYVYIPGYWTYRGGFWIYIRGGWGYPYDGIILMYAGPRPIIWISVYPAPPRIIHRHHRWRHHHERYYHHYRDRDTRSSINATPLNNRRASPAKAAQKSSVKQKSSRPVQVAPAPRKPATTIAPSRSNAVPSQKRTTQPRAVPKMDNAPSRNKSTPAPARSNNNSSSGKASASKKR